MLRFRDHSTLVISGVIPTENQPYPITAWINGLRVETVFTNALLFAGLNIGSIDTAFAFGSTLKMWPVHIWNRQLKDAEVALLFGNYRNPLFYNPSTGLFA